MSRTKYHGFHIREKKSNLSQKIGSLLICKATVIQKSNPLYIYFLLFHFHNLSSYHNQLKWCFKSHTMTPRSCRNSWPVRILFTPVCRCGQAEQTASQAENRRRTDRDGTACVSGVSKQPGTLRHWRISGRPAHSLRATVDRVYQQLLSGHSVSTTIQYQNTLCLIHWPFAK